MKELSSGVLQLVNLILPKDNSKDFPAESILDCLQANLQVKEEDDNTFLRGFRSCFSGDEVISLSTSYCGGEKVRVMLSKLMFQPNVLVLDDPTNHLDF